ncbi:MAG: 5-(carboxyamino)imidazole ribonucleotide mutase [Pseudobdellovibrionaceae bacterium]
MKKTSEILIVMGSQSDYPIMEKAETILKDFKVSYTTKIVSAHRTPELLFSEGRDAVKNGYKVVIAGAGGAAHLPGMMASLTVLPVIGVPIPHGHLSGEDALLSIVQMPEGVPVATVAIGNAANAAILALQILATGDSTDSQKIQKSLQSYKEKLKEKVLKQKI